MNFNTLRYVVAVAQERNFTKAARSAYVSQPTLSQSIQTLEANLGTPLFDRKTYPITPTYAGKIYIEFAQQVLLSEAQINRKISSIISNPRIHVRIGIAPYRSALIIPDIVRVIMDEFPNCMISIEDSIPEQELYNMLENHDLDIMIGNSHANIAKFSNQYITREHLVLAVPKAFGVQGAPPPEKDSRYARIRLVQLRDFPFVILPNRTFLGSSLRVLCEKEEFVPLQTIECTSVQTSYSLAAQGLGTALIPELMVLKSPYPDSLDYFLLQHGTPVQEIYLITNNGEHLTSPAQRFIEVFQSTYYNIM